MQWSSCELIQHEDKHRGTGQLSIMCIPIPDYGTKDHQQIHWSLNTEYGHYDLDYSWSGNDQFDAEDKPNFYHHMMVMELLGLAVVQNWSNIQNVNASFLIKPKKSGWSFSYNHGAHTLATNNF